MLYSNKKRDDLENLQELISLQDQVKALRLQDKLGKQNFHYDQKKVFEPVIDIVEDVSEDVTTTITETSIENNKAIEYLNNKLRGKMNDRFIIACCLLSLLSKITNPDNSFQFKLVKEHSSNTVNDLLTNKTIPITVFIIFIRFRDADKKIELQGDLLKLITNTNYNVDLFILSDKKLLYDFAKEI